MNSLSKDISDQIWVPKIEFKKVNKKIESSDYLTIIGSSLNKKNDNCMITSLGQKINLNSSGWDSFRQDD